MSVRAKFRVDSKTEVAPGGLFNIRMLPVTTGSEENKEFYKWTPGGELTLSTVNGAAAADLQVGKEYYLDISLAE